MKKRLIIVLIVLLLLVGIFGIMKKALLKINNTKLSNDFYINLIKLTTKDNNDNYLISPYSIKIALNMLKEGASGNTKEEIIKVLNNSKVTTIDNQNIKIANALFVNNSYKNIIEKPFENILKNNYKSEIIYDKFQSPDLINNWVREHTDKMIPKILESVDGDFVLGLANAIAIDVKWSHEFMKDLTTKETFIQKDNKKIDVEMMHQTYEREDVSYFNNNKSTGIILPYREDTNLEFVGILPNEDINTYLNNLTDKDLQNIDKDKKSASKNLHIHLSLPKFKYDFDLNTFKKILVEMGMKDAFSRSNANFSNIVTKENLKKIERDNIFVDDAIHKTAIDLNESGTKAAAVTYFGLRDSAAIFNDNYETVNINFNKTFAYMIREKNTKEILFFGVVNTPNIWSDNSSKSN